MKNLLPASRHQSQLRSREENVGAVILIETFPHPLIAHGPATLPFGRESAEADVALSERELAFERTGPRVTRQQRAGSLLNAIRQARQSPPCMYLMISSYAGHPMPSKA